MFGIWEGSLFPLKLSVRVSMRSSGYWVKWVLGKVGTGGYWVKWVLGKVGTGGYWVKWILDKEGTGPSVH